ncbi:MAG: reductive dehalogenase [Bacillota bacterium]|nr:reductive dehalogenase [Bacillota bacterium]
MNYKLLHHDILYNNEPIAPYPMHLFMRVDKPTNNIPGPIQRISQQERAWAKAQRGEIGDKVKSEVDRLIDKYPLGASLFEVRRHLQGINNHKNAVTSSRAPLPDDPRVLSRHLKSLGYFLGADLMGICEIPLSAIYQDDELGKPIEVDFKYAIIFVKRKHYRTTSASNGYDWIFDSASHQVYQVLAVWTDTVANYIRRLGYAAEASNMRNYYNLMTPLLIQSGIGEVSRMGIALNPFFGANFKAAAVLTDIPLLPDGPIDFGLQKYCSTCKICAEQCPVKAISFGDKVIYNGYETWKMDPDKCACFAILNKKGSVCGRCTKVCPWNRPGTEPHTYTDWDGNLNRLYDEVDKQASLIRSRNYVDPSEKTDKWWFDLEEIDGKLVIPSSSNYVELS